MKNFILRINADFIGMSASLLCAIHCALLPFLLSMASLSGFHFLGNPAIEASVVFISLLLACFAIVHGYRKHHGNWYPVITAAIGFLFIGFAHLLEGSIFHHLFSAAGGVLIALAHLLNWRLSRTSGKRKSKNYQKTPA
jgi:drug/metabolite transporter superfamily protein YnfA